MEDGDGPRIEVAGRLVHRLLLTQDGHPEGLSQSRRKARGRGRIQREQAQKLQQEQGEGQRPAVPIVQEPAVPSPLSVLPSFRPAPAQGTHQNAMDAISKVSETARNLKEAILEENTERMDKVKQMASELHARQFRAPARPPVCLDERRACIECYHSSPGDPLRCSSTVQAFAACARAAEERFITSEQ